MHIYTCNQIPDKVFRRLNPGEIAKENDFCNHRDNPPDCGWVTFGTRTEVLEDDELWFYREVQTSNATKGIEEVIHKTERLLSENKDLIFSLEKQQLELRGLLDEAYEFLFSRHP